MKRRLLQERLPREIPQIIKRILGDNTVEATQEISSNPNKRRRCYVCPSSKDTKYSNICSVCKKTVCKTHGVQVSKCANCMDTEHNRFNFERITRDSPSNFYHSTISVDFDTERITREFSKQSR
ncbi:hypothetical protein QTP88_014756 [Uroleucon formosanum]